jgi:hypothetical protein
MGQTTFRIPRAAEPRSHSSDTVAAWGLYTPPRGSAPSVALYRDPPRRAETARATERHAYRETDRQMERERVAVSNARKHAARCSPAPGLANRTDYVEFPLLRRRFLLCVQCASGGVDVVILAHRASRFGGRFPNQRGPRRRACQRASLVQIR